MATSLSNWPQRPSPLRTRQRVFRLVHAIRAAVRSAKVEWTGISHNDEGDTLTTKVTFSVEVEADTLDGGFVASCVDLPGCFSEGDTEEEAVSNLVEAISGVMESRMQRHLRRRPLHEPGEKPPTRGQPHRHRLELPVA